MGQDAVCKILSEHLRTRFGVDVEFSAELVDLKQDETGVTAILDVQGTKSTLRVKYLVGADGGKSE